MAELPAACRRPSSAHTPGIVSSCPQGAFCSLALQTAGERVTLPGTSLPSVCTVTASSTGSAAQPLWGGEESYKSLSSVGTPPASPKGILLSVVNFLSLVNSSY